VYTIEVEAVTGTVIVYPLPAVAEVATTEYVVVVAPVAITAL
jgi:hypothetical protein